MVSLQQLTASGAAAPLDAVEYRCRASLNLYDSPSGDGLATQAAAGRHLHLLAFDRPDTQAESAAMQVRLCEDDYVAWLKVADLAELEPAEQPYQPITLSRQEIVARLPDAIAFAKAAMQVSNVYLWGGTVAPNYDCSGLMQAAFASVGIWLPRDSYQQADFVEPVAVDDLEAGDLLFFAKRDRVSHVALYLGDGHYLHSSGKDQGRNGIAIDPLSDSGDAVSQAYYRQLCHSGRITHSYQPGEMKF